MDGIILIDKPKGDSSRYICDKVSKILKEKKVGHTGTLDPLATGLLVVLLGKGTKLEKVLEIHDKTYIAEAILGLETDTYDTEGKVLEEKYVQISEKQILDSLDILKNRTTQLPPIYSAIKVKGKKLYDYALEGKEVEIKERPIKIDVLELVDTFIGSDSKTHLKLKIKANKGFYVRSLIHDLGVLLNTGAAMCNLRRTQVGPYVIEDSYTLDDLANDNYKVITIEEVFKDYDTVEVNDYMALLVKNGVILDERQYRKNKIFKVNHNGKLLAIYEPMGDNKYRLFMKVGE